MTKFVFFFYIFRVNLFAVSQSYSLQSSWFTINSSDLDFCQHIGYSCRQQTGKT